MPDQDSRSDELLEAMGEVAHRIGLALAWTDGIKGDAAKRNSRTGSGGWKQAEQLPVDREAAVAFFKTSARSRNVCVVASRSKLVLVETDGPDELLTRFGLELPETVTVRSRRGRHFYFRPAAAGRPCKYQVDETGVTASEDGYLIGAGSLHPTGLVYEYVNPNAEIAVLPAELHKQLDQLAGVHRQEVRHRVRTGGSVTEGNRRQEVFSHALELFHRGFDEDEVFRSMYVFNERHCTPPLSHEQVRDQVRGAHRRAKQRPRPEDPLGDELEALLTDDKKEHPPKGEETRWRSTGESTSRSEDAEWEPPIPLVARPPVPTFPIDALPDWLRDWALETAREKGASVDLAGTLALGIVAGALARHVQVSPRPGWYEPTNLYLATALEPGQRKTPVFKAAFRPVRSLERRRIAEWEEQNALINLSGAILDKRRKDLIYKAAADEELDPEQLRARMDDLLEGLGETDTSPRPRLLTEDVTPEGLAQLLAEHGRIIAASDEGAAIFENFAGRYNRGSTSWDVFNKAHSAADIVVDRKSSGPVIVWDPAVTLVIATQPKVLKALWANPVSRAAACSPGPCTRYRDPPTPPAERRRCRRTC